MASNYTDDSLPQAESAGSLAVEYTLTVSDCHALDMFLFDTIVSKQLRFRVKFYARNALVGAFVSILGGLLMWGMAIVVTSTNGPDQYAVGCIVAFLSFAGVLIGFLPGSFIYKINRRLNEKRFWRHRRLMLQTGLLKAQQNCRVVLTPEGFTEALNSCEASDAVEITESKITKVSWLAVSSIDVTDEHAFFQIENTSLSFTKPGYLVLPRLAFDNEASFRAFVNTALSNREAAFQTATASLALRDARDARITR
ncbi:MAG: hypothetical protein ACYC3I_23250 [Gemmataceae bacterium]